MCCNIRFGQPLLIESDPDSIREVFRGMKYGDKINWWRVEV